MKSFRLAQMLNVVAVRRAGASQSMQEEISGSPGPPVEEEGEWARKAGMGKWGGQAVVGS